MEQRFSSYRMPRSSDEITLDMVIMAPEMVRVISPDPKKCKACELYLLTTLHDESGFSSFPIDYTPTTMPDVLPSSKCPGGTNKDGCVRIADRTYWKKNGIDRYEAWYRDEYFENHFAISLESCPSCCHKIYGKNPKKL